ncbi:ATP-grasp domain-containing protein [Paraglaciecola sp.]|uniref:ATP-grasp domain-containing protein n=1 Tax=Paraglaciecola sp. TaxID=1920173 RepID=UPI003EF754CC
MKRCALLTTDNLEEFYVYDQMLIEPLKQYGWLTEEVSWKNKDVNWNDFDVVIIRSTWDYQQFCAEFLACLRKIDASSATLENSLKVVEWNISKAYLKELQNQGVDIVPSLWFEKFDLAEIENSFSHFSEQQIVIKPLVSANSDFTYRLTLGQLIAQKTQLMEVFSNREFMVQPFLKSIVEEGEYSLFYFSGEYSHTILKQPKAGDFRVQEEHGGQLLTVEPDEKMLTAARHSLAALPDDVLYARIDLVKFKGEFVVMEIELIEPSLYFNMDPASPQRFVDAFVQRFGKN